MPVFVNPYNIDLSILNNKKPSSILGIAKCHRTSVGKTDDIMAVVFSHASAAKIVLLGPKDETLISEDLNVIDNFQYCIEDVTIHECHIARVNSTKRFRIDMLSVTINRYAVFCHFGKVHNILQNEDLEYLANLRFGGFGKSSYDIIIAFFNDNEIYLSKYINRTSDKSGYLCKMNNSCIKVPSLKTSLMGFCETNREYLLAIRTENIKNLDFEIQVYNIKTLDDYTDISEKVTANAERIYIHTGLENHISEDNLSSDIGDMTYLKDTLFLAHYTSNNLLLFAGNVIRDQCSGNIISVSSLDNESRVSFIEKNINYEPNKVVICCIDQSVECENLLLITKYKIYDQLDSALEGLSISFVDKKSLEIITTFYLEIDSVKLALISIDLIKKCERNSLTTLDIDLLITVLSEAKKVDQKEAAANLVSKLTSEDQLSILTNMNKLMDLGTNAIKLTNANAKNLIKILQDVQSSEKIDSQSLLVIEIMHNGYLSVNLMNNSHHKVKCIQLNNIDPLPASDIVKDETRTFVESLKERSELIKVILTTDNIKTLSKKLLSNDTIIKKSESLTINVINSEDVLVSIKNMEQQNITLHMQEEDSDINMEAPTKEASSKMDAANAKIVRNKHLCCSVT